MALWQERAGAGESAGLELGNTWEGRQKFLLLVTLAYAFLLSLLRDDHQPIRQWLLRYWCHRTGKRSRETSTPLYRLRAALSRLWLAHLPTASLVIQNSG